MARLNEPPLPPAPSAETIEAVKRRFLRQNRELAKTNSQQSIRIRSLENDASRLLAENLSLREQVLHIQNALAAQSNRPSFENIDAVKGRLETKIQDLGRLVAELGQLHKPDNLPRCKSQTAATRRSPDERQWRCGLGLQDIQNAMLPTISEDKYYPRRTMKYVSGVAGQVPSQTHDTFDFRLTDSSEEELQGILEDPESQSPDIGPPPVSRFDSEEAILFDANPLAEDQPNEPVDDAEPPLSANFETRKKRRESGPKLDLRRISVFQSPPQPERPEKEPTKSTRDGTAVRVGAKRKFSVQDDGEKAESQMEPFQFSRRIMNNVANDGEVSKQEIRPQSPERPVLGSKPINTDPVLSPKKQRSSSTSKPEKKASNGSRSTHSRIKITRRPMQDVPSLHIPAEQPEIAEINLDSLPPKTPATDDVFSPPSTEPSTQRADSKDTPPPGDLDSCGQTALGVRPSRRVRAQVSYKEPKLNVKMRRPGKELVDAVQLPFDKRSSVGSQTAPLTSEKVSCQGELRGADAAWNAPSPTAIRGVDEQLGSPLCKKLDRKEGGLGTEPGDVVELPKLNPSAASNAISALLQASTSRRKSALTQPAMSSAEKEKRSGSMVSKTGDTGDVELRGAKQEDEDKDNLAIFNFTESPPTNEPAKSRIDLAKTCLRYSAMPMPSSASNATARNIDSKPKAKTNAGLQTLHSRTGSGTGSADANGSRSASTGHLAKNTILSRATASVKEKKAAALPTSGSHIDLKVAVAGEGTWVSGNGSGNGTGSLRAERAASRRKSMML